MGGGGVKIAPMSAEMAAAENLGGEFAAYDQPPAAIFDPLEWDMAEMNAWLVHGGFAKQARRALLLKVNTGAMLFALTEQQLSDEVGGPFAVLGARKRLLALRRTLLEDALSAATPAAARSGVMVLDVDGTIEEAKALLRKLRATAAHAQSDAAAAEHAWVKGGNAQPWQRSHSRKVAGVAGTVAVVLEGIFHLMPAVPSALHMIVLFPLMLFVSYSLAAAMNI